MRKKNKFQENSWRRGVFKQEHCKIFFMGEKMSGNHKTHAKNKRILVGNGVCIVEAKTEI